MFYCPGVMVVQTSETLVPVLSVGHTYIRSLFRGVRMPRIEYDSLSAFTEKLLVSLGTTPELAPDVAESLATSDLRGHSSHGVRQLTSKYTAEIDDGKIDPRAEPDVERTTGPLTQVDGNLAFGQLVGQTAVDAAIARAREYGVGLAALKRTSHIGRVGEFAERACEAGMGFVAFVCNPATAWVAPPGSTQRRFSTNPIAIGMPTFGALEFPLVADVATSQVANGKIKERTASGEPLPREWLVDDSGADLTAASRYVEDGAGALLPLGGRTSGYKGFGLAVMSELMAANFADGTVSGMDDVIPGNHAAFFVADIEAVTTRERAAERAAAMAEYVYETDVSATLEVGPGMSGESVLLPGEAEHRAERRHRRDGIPFSPEDAAALAALARDNGADDSVPAPFG